MSDPQRPGEASRPSIADAAALFDSTEVRTLNPAPSAPPSASPPAVDDSANAYDLEDLPGVPATPTAASSPPVASAIPDPPRAARARAKPPVEAGRSLNPDDEIGLGAPMASSSSSPSVRTNRRSRPEVDPEADPSERAPSRARARKSERDLGIEDDAGDSATSDEPADVVDPVWTRGAEWAPDLVRVASAFGLTLILAYFAWSLSFTLAFLVVVLGGAVAVLLSYPILITIERPVRMTPEQAVTDFFEAAGHHLPHYRRMWLLLSPTARSAGRFANFGAFRAHWEQRFAEWKTGRGGRFTPLNFRIVDFRGDKSVGQSATRVEYTVQVFIRGEESGKPITSAAMKHGLVRGPDRMWYLNQGTIPSAGR